MNNTAKAYAREFFSMSLSIAVHLLLLIPISAKITQNDIILLHEIVQQDGGNRGEENFGIDVAEQDIDLAIDLNSFKRTKKEVHKKITRIITPQNKKNIKGNKNKKNNINIDQRGIYKGASNGIGNGTGNGTGNGNAATLNIPGWTWDSQPIIEDNSNEVGKIVFEFTIDDLGYVIGVRTLEKTVSSYVEKLYRDAILNLTFKKIDKVQPQEETIGRITFILKYSE